MAQHSMFSSGIANTSLAVAELMQEFGHQVDLIQLTDGTWWDDCKTLKEKWNVVRLDEAKGYDLVVEIDRLMLTTSQRKIATNSVLILRKPFVLQELESVLYPTTQTPKREFEGLKEIWIMDAAVAMEEGCVEALELLSSLPVRVVPYLWTPTIATTHIEESGLGSWLDATVSELRRVDASGATMPPWTVHIGETNTTSASSAVLPLVILREAKRRGTRIGGWRAHNTDMITKSKFFMENIVKNCTDAEVGLSGEFVGRQRSVEWVRNPMSFVLSHLRFMAIRPMLLDLAWTGVPVVHNSSLLRDVGNGLERSYYSGNHVGEACEAIRKMEEDLVTIKGIFAPGATKAVQVQILEKFTPLSAGVKRGWLEALQGLAMPLATPKPLAATAKTFRVGFCDMWENFVPEYNFFTLMLAAANPSVQVVGGPASAADDVIIFGPFGEAWKRFDQPKIHFTGENTPPNREAKLNLGFNHFDMINESYLRFPLWLLEIDWFGADAQRIVNPKPIPLERCTKVFASELAAKKNFCAFVVSNPSNPIRNAAYQWLCDYKPVDSAGRLFNTLGPKLFAGAGGGGGELSKLEFLKSYKFCLAYENSSGRGYTTEKYLHAKAAGCIPIYWGDPALERDFNPAGCIDAREFKSPGELIEAVRRVDTDDAEWLKRFSVPALDPYRVAWAYRTMAECARRIFGLGGFDTNSIPVSIAPEAAAQPVALSEPVTQPAALSEPVAQPAALSEPVPVAQPVPVTQPQPNPLEVPHMVTCATRKYLPSLQHWLVSIGTQTGAMPGLQATIFLSSDVPRDTVETLKEKFPFATFESLPDSQPPTGAFSDFWAPHHFGWKLWIFAELAARPALAGKMIFYMDAGAFLCRWPKDWMLKAQTAGLCLLEDPREENRRWCSPDFCAALSPTETELAAQQRLGGLVMFRAGADLPCTVFREAFELAKRREVLTGPKWSGLVGGKPTGHRHDQSILSILSLRHSVAVHPLDTVYCDVSLRKTFTSGRALYVHRGDFHVHREFAPSIDEAYVINLARRADRLERLWTTSPELNGRVQRWPAVDGKTLELTPAIQRLFKPNDFFWKKAVMGCALSHLGLWWKLANEGPDIKNYLILEDDVKLRPDWEKAWTSAQEDIPDDYDIIYLGGVLPPNRAMFDQTKERVNDSFCRVKENTLWGQKTPNRYFHFCAYSYILSKRGAEKVIGLIENAGYWTSADHILCNPVDELKSYVFDPILAGCYQDDDPKYASSQFNDFSRIDGFDSDLWNNDERFTPGESEGDIDIAAALGFRPVEPKVQHDIPRRFVALDVQKLDVSHLYECEWLHEIFGKPKMFIIEPISPRAPPPTDCPIVVFQKPHIETLTAMVEKWDSFGQKFMILHLSDEHLTDDISAYSLPCCTKVLRFYVRPDMPPKVTTIPLGYHWTLHEGSKNMLTHTPRLPFRELTWSFFGTDWNGRGKDLEPLFSVGKYESQFFSNWNHSSSLSEEKYVSTLMNSMFVPCPDGMNPETFRFYEAMECGCLPILVKTDRNAAWIEWITEHLPILPVESWEAAAKLMEQLLEQKPMLESYRARVLEGWMDWKRRIRDEMKTWLSS